MNDRTTRLVPGGPSPAPGVSDKVVQGYLPSYLKIAAALGPEADVLELGVAEGYSLELWETLFPLGFVTGVDKDIRGVEEDGGSEREGRRRLLQMDQADPALAEAVGGPFDLIVDDCSHFGDLTQQSISALWPLLRPGGYYVIEDWYCGLPGFQHHMTANPRMLQVVQGLLLMLDWHYSDADEITYRLGLAIVHKRKDPE